jgi:hypothetical protein
MPAVVVAAEAELTITYSSFSLLTGPGSVDPLTRDPGQAIATFADNGLGLLSAANNHIATVRVECWDAPAAPVPEAATALGTVILDEGPIVLLGVDTGEAIDLMDPPFTGPATAQVSCVGRAEAVRHADENELFFAGVERWTIRFWPADQVRRPTNS